MMLLQEGHPQVTKSRTHFWSLVRVMAPFYWHDNFSKFLSRQQQSNNVSHTVDNQPPFSAAQLQLEHESNARTEASATSPRRRELGSASVS